MTLFARASKMCQKIWKTRRNKDRKAETEQETNRERERKRAIVYFEHWCEKKRTSSASSSHAQFKFGVICRIHSNSKWNKNISDTQVAHTIFKRVDITGHKRNLMDTMKLWLWLSDHDQNMPIKFLWWFIVKKNENLFAQKKPDRFKQKWGKAVKYDWTSNFKCL